MKAVIRQKIKASLAVSTIVVFVLVGYRFGWTGFAGRTLWDWMDLALIPAALASLAWWFNQREKKNDVDMKAFELQVAAENREEEVVQAYLDRMQILLLEKNLLAARHGDVVAEVARELSLIALKRLSPKRKGIIVGFLSSSHLVQPRGKGQPGTVSLTGADLGGLGEPLGIGMLDLVGAELFAANLAGAKLDVPNLQDADLRGVVFEGARLTYPDLRGANLHTAQLLGANIFEPSLDKDTILPNGEHWSGSDLTEFGATKEPPFTDEQIREMQRELNIKGRKLGEDNPDGDGKNRDST